MIAIEARLGIALVAGLFGVWLAVARTDAPPAASVLPEPPALVAQRQVAYEDPSSRMLLEEVIADQNRQLAFSSACAAGGGQACCGQGGCCPGTLSRAEYEALMYRLTGERLADPWSELTTSH